MLAYVIFFFVEKQLQTFSSSSLLFTKMENGGSLWKIIISTACPFST